MLLLELVGTMATSHIAVKSLGLFRKYKLSRLEIDADLQLNGRHNSKHEVKAELYLIVEYCIKLSFSRQVDYCRVVEEMKNACKHFHYRI
jgi:hypothetical protein